MSKTYSKTRILVECALMIAIGTVLSNIKIFTMPNGGSVTLLSMLPFVLVSFRHGVKWGLFTGFVNGCLQMLLGFWAPPTPTFLYFLGEILLDYIVAFMALGTAELFGPPLQEPDGRRGLRHLHGRFPALHVQLPVRRAGLGQPERRPERLDLQLGLQRQLHAAGDPPHAGGRRPAHQGGTPDLRPPVRCELIF